MSATEPLYVSISTAARLLDCHRNTVTRLVKNGVLAKEKIGTLERIPMASIRALTADPPADVRVARPRRTKRKAVKVA